MRPFLKSTPVDKITNGSPVLGTLTGGRLLTIARLRSRLLWRSSPWAYVVLPPVSFRAQPVPLHFQLFCREAAPVYPMGVKTRNTPEVQATDTT
jgi:hypothetical protein